MFLKLNKNKDEIYGLSLKYDKLLPGEIASLLSQSKQLKSLPLPDMATWNGNTLTIDTDGTIDPAAAFEESAAILVTQYQALAGNTSIKADDLIGGDSDQSVDLLGLPVEELNLSARTTNALISAGIKTVNDLVSLTDEELNDLKGFGAKAREEVKEKVAELEF